MQTQDKTWGNRQGIRLSKDISQAANININTFRHKALEERAAAFSGNLHLDGEFDFGKPVGREVW